MRPRFPRSGALLLVLLLLVTPPALLAQDVERRIEEIRALYGQIEGNLGSYRNTRKEYHDLAVRGTVEAWWEDDEPRKVVVLFDGDGASGRVEYFYQGDRPFFVFDLWETFPMWPQDDPDDFGRTESRFYFDGTELVRWLIRSHESGMVNRAVDPTEERFHDQGHWVWDRARLFRAFAGDEEEDLDEFRASWRGWDG